MCLPISFETAALSFSKVCKNAVSKISFRQNMVKLYTIELNKVFTYMPKQNFSHGVTFILM